MKDRDEGVCGDDRICCEHRSRGWGGQWLDSEDQTVVLTSRSCQLFRNNLRGKQLKGEAETCAVKVPPV